MNLNDITIALQGKPATQGWDAVCAIDATAMNQLLMRWFLADNPAAPVHALQTRFQGRSSSFLLDAELGPPEITLSIGRAATSVVMTRLIVSGTLIEYEAGSEQGSERVLDAVILDSDTCRLYGALDPSKVAGTTTLGAVALQLGTGSWTVEVAGLAGSWLQEALNDAVTRYYADNATSVPIGAVTTAAVGAWLQPTTFDLALQKNPQDPDGGCLLILITTNGRPGVLSPLPVYPIPDGSTVALLVSNQVLFNGLFPSQLSNAGLGLTFSGEADGYWTTLLRSGSVDLGVFSYPDLYGQPYSSNKETEHWYSTAYESAPVVVPVGGLRLSPGGTAGLAGNLWTSWDQGWAFTGNVPGAINWQGGSYATATTTLTYHALAPVTISQPSTCVVTFPWSGTPQCTSKMDSALEELFSGVDPGSRVQADLPGLLGPVFGLLTLAEVDTFALQNLLFYPNESLLLTQGTVPADLLLTGTTAPTLSVTPGWLQAAPGSQPVQFTATLRNGTQPAHLVWERSPAIGSISQTGQYTPPGAIKRPTLVRITATDGTDAAQAVVLMAPDRPTGLLITPPSVIVAPGRSIPLTVTTSAGMPAQVSWALDPPGVGQVVSTGSGWTYQAPATIGAATKVTLTATKTTFPPSTGTAAIAVVPSGTLSLSASADSIGPGGSVRVTASSSSSLADLRWLIQPAGVGTIATDGATATYTAPSTVSVAMSIVVVAYSLGNDTPALLGSVSISLRSQT